MVRTLRSASAAAPRRWCSGAVCRRAVRRDAAVPGGGFQGRSSTATSTSAPWRRDHRSCPAALSSACTPTRSAYVVPAGVVAVVPEGVPPARAVLAGTVETRRQRPGDAAPLLGDRVTVVGAGMATLRRTPAEPVPGGAGHTADVDAGRADVAAGPGRLRAAGRRRRRSRPGRARQRDVRRAPAVARPARTRGHGHRPQLVRRQRGPAFSLVARSTRVASASVPARWAPSPRPAAGAARRPTGWHLHSICCATPLRRAPHRAVPLRRAARRDGPAGRWEPARALPHHHLRRGIERVQRDRPRSHDDRPQLRGEVSPHGACTARRTSSTPRSGARPSTPTASWLTSVERPRSSTPW